MIKKVICRKEIRQEISIAYLLDLTYTMKKQVNTYPGDTISEYVYTEFEQSERKKYPILIVERNVSIC